VDVAEEFLDHDEFDSLFPGLQRHAVCRGTEGAADTPESRIP
jgi:hypothetical protein